MADFKYVYCIACSRKYDPVDKESAPDAVVFFYRHKQVQNRATLHACCPEHLIAFLLGKIDDPWLDKKSDSTLRDAIIELQLRIPAQNAQQTPIPSKAQPDTHSAPIRESQANMARFVQSVKGLMDCLAEFGQDDVTNSRPAVAYCAEHYQFVEAQLEELLPLVEILEAANAREDREIESRRAALSNVPPDKRGDMFAQAVFPRPVIGAKEVDELLKTGHTEIIDTRISQIDDENAEMGRFNADGTRAESDP